MIRKEWRRCANIRTGRVVSALLVDHVAYQFVRTILPDELILVRSGDYLVAYPDGTIRVFTPDRFDKAYYFTEG